MALIQLPKHLHPDFADSKLEVPNGPVVVDTSNPLTKGLVHYFIPSEGKGMLDVVTGTYYAPYTDDADITIEHTTKGKHLNTVYSDNTGFWRVNEFTLPADPGYVIMWLAAKNTAGGNLGMVAGERVSGASYLWMSSTSDAIHFYNNGQNDTYGSLPADNAQYVWRALVVDGTTRSLHMLNTKDTETRSSTDYIVNVLTGWNNSSFHFAGDYGPILFFDLPKSDAEISALMYTGQPKQLLKPAVPITYYIPDAAAAATSTKLYQLPKHLHPDFATKGVEPKNQVAVDYTNPISEGLAGFWLLNEEGQQVDIVHGGHGSLLGTITWARKPDGTSVYVTGGGAVDAGVGTQKTINAASGAGFSGIAAVHPTGSGAIVTKRDGATKEFLWGVSGSAFTYDGTTGGGTIGANDSAYQRIGFSLDNGGDVTGYHTGIAESTVSSITSTRQDVNLSFCSRFSTYPGLGYGYDGDVYYVGLWNRELSAAEHHSLSLDPFQVLKPAVPLTYYTASAGGATAYDLATDSGSYTYTGTAASIEAGLIIATDSGSYSYTGTAVALDVGYELITASGTYNYTGTTIDLDFASAGSYELETDTGAYTYSGTAASIEAGRILITASGSYAYTGTATALDVGYELVTASGAYVYTGTAVALDKTSEIAATSGAYAYSGATVILTYSGEGIWAVQGVDTTTWTEQSIDTSTWTVQ